MLFVIAAFDKPGAVDTLLAGDLYAKAGVFGRIDSDRGGLCLEAG